MEPTSLAQALAGERSVREIARRDMLEPEAARGNDNTLWVTMQSGVRVLNRQYTMTSYPIELFEASIRNIFQIFILAAKNIDVDHPAQDRLTRLVLWSRDLGVLTRGYRESQGSRGHQPSEALGGESSRRKNSYGIDAVEEAVSDAVTSDGLIWVDLPFLVQEVEEAWIEVMAPSSSAAQRRNLTAAIGRLAGVGVRNEAFSSCGLAIMIQALEQPAGISTSRAFSSAVETNPDTSEHSSLGMLDMLELVQIWLRYAGNKLLQLCLANAQPNDTVWKLSDPHIGRLALDAGVDSTGFSQGRYVFWRDRLTILKEDLDENVRDVATPCSNMMNGIWNDVFGVRT